MAKSFQNRPVFLWIIVLGACIFLMLPLAEQIEAKYGLSQLMRWRGVQEPPRDTVIVAITENTAEILGKSKIMTEWSRQVYADLVERLQILGAKTIVFDIFFSRASDKEGDLNFAEALEKHGNSILFAKSTRTMHPLSSGLVAEIDRITEPLSVFQQSAKNTAPFVLPKVPALVSSFMIEHVVYPPRKTIPALALQLSAPTRWASLAKTEEKRFWYNFYGPPKTIKTIAFEDILTDSFQLAQDLHGATVFIGFSSKYQPEQDDGFQTAFTSEGGHDLSGVELAATAFANLRDDTYVRKGHILLWPMVCLFYALLGFWLVLRHERFTMPGLLVMASGQIVTTFLVFRLLTFWLPWLIPVFVITPVLAVYGYQRRLHRLQVQRENMESVFGRYIPSKEIDRLVRNPQIKISEEKFFGVCMATDAAGYTSVVEKLGVDELGELMHEYLAVIINPIRKSGGIVSDVAGDGVIAVWPHLNRDTAYPSIRPVIQAIQDGIGRFNKAHPETPLPTRIGVHAGELVLGHFGAADHFEYRAIGNIVNTASRIESANKKLGTMVLMSGDCLPEREKDRKCLGLKFLGPHLLKGKAESVLLYTF